MKSKIIVILFVCVLFSSINIIALLGNSISNSFDNVPRSSPSYSTEIIRPNGEFQNSGFLTIPPGSDIDTCIDDMVNSPSTGGDSDYIYGTDIGIWSEVFMGQVTLEGDEVVTAIRIFARGSRLFSLNDELSVDFKWRVGEGSYLSTKNLHFSTSPGFSWLATSSWTGLNINQAALNDLQVHMALVGTDLEDQIQAISVMYIELTIKSNAAPIVNFIYPNGGEILRTNTLIEWAYNDPDGDSVTFDLSYRENGGAWQEIVSGLTDQTAYLWNLSSYSYKTNVELLIEASDGDTGYSIDISDAAFTIQYNHEPDVRLVYPNGGEVLREDTLITWEYWEIDNESTFFNLSYQINYGAWISIVDGLENQTTFLWNSSVFDQSHENLSILIEAFDPYNGSSNDTSDYLFRFLKNSPPSIEIISPTQESLKDSVTIQWNYDDSENDTVFFNISYSIDGIEWNDIITGLINQSSYNWDLSQFSQTLSNVSIRIVAYDLYQGSTTIVLPGNYTITAGGSYLPDNPYLPLLIIILSISIPSISATAFIVHKKRKKKRREKDKLAELKSSQEKSKLLGYGQENNKKQIIIEADLLVKKGKSLNQRDLLSRLLSNDEIDGQKAGNDEYEVIKVLGKLNITTLSEDFWNKIEQFEWQGNEKEEFINDMLALAPECRERFINEMLHKFRERGDSIDF